MKLNAVKNWMESGRLLALALGVGFIFYGARYADGQPLGMGLTIAGFVLFALALGWSVWRMRTTASAAERDSWSPVVLWQVMFIAGFVVFMIYRKVMGQAAEPETTLTRLLLASWLSLIMIGAAWGIGVEWAFRASGRGRYAEPQRVRRAGRAWVLVGLLLGSIVSLNYVAVRKDRSFDWSYLKTTRPSESTTKVLGSLDKELRIGLFFAANNEVLSYVRTYFDNLPQKEALVKIEYFDADLNPTAAEAFKASRNGQVILKYGDASERIELGASLSTARKTLRNLDAEFQKSLLAATQKRKVLYFTRGHGELSWSGSDNEGMRSIKLLEGFLRGQNYTMRFFGIGEGSTKQVPDDADAVVVIGGNTPMLEEEASAINEYVAKGGSLLSMLDLDTPTDELIAKGSRDIHNDPFVKMLADHGVKYVPTPLANATNFVAASRSEADAWFLFTNTFTSHDSVTALARNDQRAAVLTFRSGYLTMTSELSGWQNFETVRSLSDTFADENRDFKFTEGKETRNAYIQGVATIRKEADAAGGKRGKMVTFSDASAASDLLVRNQGNLIFIAEALRWLAGDNKGAGGTGVAASEEDVRIRHTRKEDIAWFYGTVVAVPLLVLGLGYFSTRRARRKS